MDARLARYPPHLSYPFSQESAYGRTKDVLKKVTHPTDMEAKSLSKYFPNKKVFNPTEGCLRPKKSGSKKERPVAITVIMPSKL